MTSFKQELVRIEYIEGVTIFSEGEKAQGAYLIENGEVEIYKTIKDKKIVIATLGPGEIIGEMGIINGKGRCASAIAKKKTRLVKISKGIIQEKINEADTIVRAILHASTKRLEISNQESV